MRYFNIFKPDKKFALRQTSAMIRRNLFIMTSSLTIRQNLINDQLFVDGQTSRQKLVAMLLPKDSFYPTLAFLQVLMENTDKLVAKVNTPVPKKRSKRSSAAIAKRKQKYKERQLGFLKRDKEILACDLVAKEQSLRAAKAELLR